MKKTILPLFLIIVLLLSALCGCGSAKEKAQEYYNDLKGYVDDAKEIVGDLGDKAGDVVEDINNFLGGNSDDAKSYEDENDAAAAKTAPSAGSYTFRSQKQFDQHFEKHGAEFGSITQSEYLELANDLIANPDALTKTDNGDTLFYDKYENEFAVLSDDGYIRTFFKPSDGLDYWNRQ